MKKRISELFFRNLLMKGSLVVLVGSLLGNCGNYFYHLLMGRWLGPANYGILESLISILTLLSISVSVLGLVIVKYISQEKKEDNEKIFLFIRRILEKVIPIGLLTTMVFLAAYPILKIVIKVDSFTLFLGTGLAFYLGIFSTVFSSTFQGMLKFTKLSLLNIFGSWSKLLIGTVLVFFGLNVGGAIYSIVLAALATSLLGYSLLRVNFFSLRKNVSFKFKFKNVKSYSLCVLLSLFSLNSLFLMDVILARHYLSPTIAGQYAAFSVLGKIIFFASSPVILVMFPLISKRHSNNQDATSLFSLSVFLVVGISVAISLVYYLFPDLMVKLLFGNAYLGSAASLGSFAIFISLYSLCALLVNFYLSISDTKAIVFPVVFAILQIILICFYHQTIGQIITVNILTLSLLLLGLFAYFFKKYLKIVAF